MKTFAKCLMVLAVMTTGTSSVLAEESTAKIMLWETRAVGAKSAEDFMRMVKEQPTAAGPKIEEPMPATPPRLLEEKPQQEGGIGQSRH